MLKLHNLIFYIICNSYRKHENYEKDAPPLNIFFVFTISFYCQILLFIGLLKLLENPYYRSLGIPKLINIFFFLSCFAITYFLFYLNKKYVVIYNTYKNDLFANSHLGKFMGWSFIILSILLPFLSALIINKIYLGNWV